MSLSLEVRRSVFTKRSTSGQLAIDGVPQCFTLEPPQQPDPNGNGFVCIPEGTFPLTIRWSNEFKKLVPHVENVPGRTAIEIHIGNYPDDTHGCTLVGKSRGDQPDFVAQSGMAWALLMTKLYDGATLKNPDSPEIYQIWDVGQITYKDIGGS